MASHFGGTRNGMVMHRPKGIRSKGAIRSPFHHVVETAPTVLEAAGIPQPKQVNGFECFNPALAGRPDPAEGDDAFTGAIVKATLEQK